MRWIDLTHPIASGMAQYPGDRRPVRLIQETTHAAAGYLATSLELGCHVGTHVDAPLHFRPGAPALDALPLGAFAGSARVLDVGEAAAAGPIGIEALPDPWRRDTDFLLLRTGWSRHWGTPAYYARWPWLDPALAARLAGSGLRGVGLDTPSADPRDGRACHDAFAAAGLVNLENLAALEALPAGPFLLVALPLKLAGAEASPVRAAALVDVVLPVRDDPR